MLVYWLLYDSRDFLFIYTFQVYLNWIYLASYIPMSPDFDFDYFLKLNTKEDILTNQTVVGPHWHS